VCADTDGDGQPDYLDPDDDNDGAADDTELLAGTDPLDPGSEPFIGVPDLAGGWVTFPIEPAAGRRYQLQCTTNLTAPVWENVGSPVEDPATLEVSAPATSGAAFYRWMIERLN